MLAPLVIDRYKSGILTSAVPLRPIQPFPWPKRTMVDIQHTFGALLIGGIIAFM